MKKEFLYKSRTSMGTAGLMAFMLVGVFLTNGIDLIHDHLGIAFPVFVLSPLLVVVLSVIADIEDKPIIRAASTAAFFIAFAFFSTYGMIVSFNAAHVSEFSELSAQALRE